jgi:ParB family chromosome partitioning protein
LTDLPQDIREECRKDPNISRRTLLAIAKKKTTKEMRSAFDRYKMKHGNKGDNQPKKKIGKTSFDKLASKLHAVTNSLGKIDYQKTDETARRNLVSLIEEYNREISEILNKIKMMDNSNEA